MSYQYLVIGAGSGGLASARRAAKLYGVKVAIVEAGRLGGTCVNVGCVPKKVSYNAAFLADCLKYYAPVYGFQIPSSSQQTDDSKPSIEFDWPRFKKMRDAYVQRLNGIYNRNLENDGVELLKGYATLVSPNKVKIISVSPVDPSEVTEQIVTADRILIATGGEPMKPLWPGSQFCLDSDGFFDLEQVPRKCAVIGAGYIAVELAGVLNSFGSDVSLVIRHGKPLRSFDSMLSDTLLEQMEKSGIRVIKFAEVDKITCADESLSFDKERLTSADSVNSNSFNVHLKRSSVSRDQGEGEEPSISCIENCQTVLVAIGRTPNSRNLNLESVGVETSQESGLILVDKFQNTSVDGIYALGDVTGPVYLTPVAIAAGRRLADRLFGGVKDAYMDYDSVPSVVFSHPPLGSVGLTESEARRKYGTDAVRIYTSKFYNMFYCFARPEDKPLTIYKLVCVGAEERVVGVHIIGMGSDEILQGFAVAVKMKCTKADFDRTVAIHPTAAEELVTMR